MTPRTKPFVIAMWLFVLTSFSIVTGATVGETAGYIIGGAVLVLALCIGLYGAGVESEEKRHKGAA